MPMGFGAVMMSRSRVLLSLIVSAMPMMVRCLPMVMGRGLVVTSSTMMMFRGRMRCRGGHEVPPVVRVRLRSS
jgi:hypothetical protein